MCGDTSRELWVARARSRAVGSEHPQSSQCKFNKDDAVTWDYSALLGERRLHVMSTASGRDSNDWNQQARSTNLEGRLGGLLTPFPTAEKNRTQLEPKCPRLFPGTIPTR